MQLFLIGLAENGCKFTFYVLKFIRIYIEIDGEKE